MSIIQDIKESIIELEQNRFQNINNGLETQGLKDATQSELDELKKTLGLRERYLGGWFGGDKEKTALYKSLTSLVQEYDGKITALNATAEGYDQKIIEKLDEHLRVNDPVYGQLVIPKDAAEKLHESVRSFMQKIDHALSEIDSAQGMETMDMFSKSKAISFMSYAANSDASSAIGDVKSAAPDFQAAVHGYTSEVKCVNVEDIKADIGDGFDLALDFVFDGFDFMSMFTLSALGSAESDMEDVRDKVSKVDEYVSANLDKANHAVATYIKSARLECNS